MLRPKFSEIGTASRLQHAAQLHGVNYQQMLYDFSRLSSEVLTKKLNDDIFLNLTTLFQDVDDSVYVDWVHYNDVGNYLISKRLSTVVFSRAKE